MTHNPPLFSLAQVIENLRTSFEEADIADTAEIEKGPYRSWSGTTVTYSIPDAMSPDAAETAFQDPNRPTTLMETRVIWAFELWDDLIAIDLNLLDNTNSANIDFAYATQTLQDHDNNPDTPPVLTVNGGTYTRTSVTGSGDSRTITRADLWFNSNDSRFNDDADFALGQFGFTTYLHEIGHSLGLSHPGSYNGRGNYHDDAEFLQDTLRYSVMSYFRAEDDGSGTDHLFGSVRQFASTPMVFDIAAIQAIYGADPTTRVTDTTYGFNTSFDYNTHPYYQVYDFTINVNPIVTIYDAGGIDTLDLSGFNFAQRIDLRAGFYSDVGGFMTNNLAIAVGTTIENAVGGTGRDTITGNGGANTLDGGPDADTLIGGGGNDLYVVDNLGDVVTEGVNEGVLDAVHAFVSGYTLPANVEVGWLRLAAGGTLTGNDLANTMLGSGGGDTLIGGGGDDQFSGNGGLDTFIGGADNDWYFIDNLGTTVVENPGEGFDDRIYVRVNGYTVPDNVEGAYIDLTTGLTLYGNADGNFLVGNAGDDILDGRGGQDAMQGGGGDDTYHVDDRFDATSEAPNEGTADRVISSAAYYELYPNIEIGDIAVATGAILVGNSGANRLNGNEGEDELYGGGGDDDLFGGAGEDLLVGGQGRDSMFGGPDNDTYHIDRIDEFVIELEGEGDADEVVTFVTGYTLPDQVEYGRIGVSDGLILTGNLLDNHLFGGAGSDTLDGGLGNDTLSGGANYVKDILDGKGGLDWASYADAPSFLGAGTLGIKVNLAEGRSYHGTSGILGFSWAPEDELFEIENVEGSLFNDILTGDAGTNRLKGLAGDDTLDGGLGVDTAVFSGNRPDYAISRLENGDIVVTDQRPGAPDGEDTLSSVEFLAFADATLSVAAIFNTAPVAQNGGAGADEDTVIFGQAAASDLETNPADLVYSLVSQAAHGTVTLNPDGLFSYQPDANFNGADSFTFRASDGLADSNTATVTLTVNAVPDAPVITSDGGGGAAALSVAENMAAVTIVTATDPDGDTPAYSIVGGADAPRFQINPTTGALSFIQPPDFEAPDDADRDNAYVVQVRASDGALFSDQTITVNVTDEGGVVPGTGGNDVLVGSSEQDILIGSAGNDLLDGRDDIDTVDYGWTGQGVVVNLGAGQASGAEIDTDQLIGIENVIGGSGDDRITGDNGDNLIVGGPGADVLDGSGRKGSDTDTVSYASSSAAVTVNLDLKKGVQSGGDAEGDVLKNFENVIGSSFDDILTGGKESGALYGGDGDDTLIAGKKGGALYGGDGDDTLIGGNAPGILDGGAGDDTLIGGKKGGDTIFGGDGTDTLLVSGKKLTLPGFDAAALSIEVLQGSGGGIRGSKGDDVFDFSGLIATFGVGYVDGDKGDDIFVSGAGDDVFRGGAGNDAFVFGAGFGHDAISDFRGGPGVADVIKFDQHVFSDFSAVLAAAEQYGKNTVITYDADTTLTLENIALTSLVQDDFAFL